MRRKELIGSYSYFVDFNSVFPDLFGSGTQNCTTKRAKAESAAALRKTMLNPKASII